MKKDSKINDLLQKAREHGHFDMYYEWDIPKRYDFPVFKEQVGSSIFVYRLPMITEKFENKNSKYEKLVDDYQYEVGACFGGGLEKTKAIHGKGKKKILDSNMKGMSRAMRGFRK